jgi:hypothetical protein
LSVMLQCLYPDPGPDPVWIDLKGLSLTSERVARFSRCGEGESDQNAACRLRFMFNEKTHVNTNQYKKQ